MRLWHKDLIGVLPRQQLIGQWRECCCIAKAIQENGTPNHILVNKITDYPLSHFEFYAKLICDEMKRRNYKCNYSKFSKYLSSKENNCTYNNLFADWHNTRYLMQCYSNLQEKYDCEGINKEEWNLIQNQILNICQKEMTNYGKSKIKKFLILRRSMN